MTDISTCTNLWCENARRHLQMAVLLLDAGFGDGCYFHLYHALECGASATIVSRDKIRIVPLDHAEKMSRAQDLLSVADADLAGQFTDLLDVLGKRNQALYVSAISVPPWTRKAMHPLTVRPKVEKLTGFLASLERLLTATE